MGLEKLTVEQAILLTIPNSERQRNGRLFEFARYLKAMPQYSDCDDVSDLRDLVKQWHTRALPYIKTRQFEETWADFIIAWKRVKFPKGQEPMAKIFQKAIESDPPGIVLQLYPGNQVVQLLASLCYQLQQARDDRPFFLSCRTAGRLLEMSYMQANRYLIMFEAEKLLSIVNKGGPGMRATRYRWTGGT